MSASVLGLIPARGGSKGVANKNLRDVAGHPLIAYSIAAALQCPAIDRVVVTTDSEAIAEASRTYGADVPFMRPAELAQDQSPDIDYVRHAIDTLQQAEGSEFEVIAQLRPTTPLRDPAVMADAVTAFAARDEATGLRSVEALPEPPQKMMGLEDGWLTGLFPHDPRPEYYNLPRQMFPPAYRPNGYIDLIRPSLVRDEDRLYGGRVMGFVTPVSVEIDTQDDFDQLVFTLTKDTTITNQLFGESAGRETA